MLEAFSDFDRRMMRRCFQLAQKGRARVHPNPMVGAVIVKNGHIIAEGYHQYFGGPHAEVDAFRNAREDVTGATLYCNLEPCCHTNKKTPPCTPLIISKKIKRVVVCNIDPNPEVSGKGLQQLREAGIEVQAGLLKEEGEELNRCFFTNMREQRPYVTVKVAQSLDGFIAVQKGRQTWLTAEKAVRFVHRLRSFYDAVLVGAGTVWADDPQLTVRRARGPNPRRIIVSPGLNLPLSAGVFSDSLRSKTIVLTSPLADREKIETLKSAGVQIVLLKTNKDGRFNLNEVLTLLWQKFKIGSLLVEGGQKIFSSFWNAQVWDEWIVLQTAHVLGKGLPALEEAAMADLVLKDVKNLSPDVALIYRKKKSDKGA